MSSCSKVSMMVRVVRAHNEVSRCQRIFEVPEVGQRIAKKGDAACGSEERKKVRLDRLSLQYDEARYFDSTTICDRSLTLLDPGHGG